jgi:AcrR family transcriptional regulator
MNALERLLEKVGYEKISVSQICSEAGISRATFYYHFKDKFEIVQWHFNYIAEHLLFETGRTLSWYQALNLNTVEVAKRNKLYQGAFESRGYPSHFTYFKRRRAETLIETVEKYHNVALDEELLFQIESLVEAEVAAISRWFKKGMPCSIEKISKLIEDIVPRRLYHILNEPINPTHF